MKGMEVDKPAQTGGDAHLTSNDETEYKHQKDISTFIFMDLETTSLLGGNQKPRIAELCLVALHRSDLQNVFGKKKAAIPRITNKLSICLDPGKPMSFGSSEITGLFNDRLQNQKRLSGKTVALIRHFMDHLTKPICLLAHNGYRFDFPVLKAELNRTGENLCEDILCADTLEAFRSLDGLPARNDPFASQNHRSIYQGYTPKSTQIVWNKAPGVKRKPTENESCKTNPKISKHNIDQFDVTMRCEESEHNKVHKADKVKKKLFVDEIASEEKTTKLNLSNETKQGEDSQEYKSDEFSSSLEDSDYLLALENVENDLRNTDSSTSSVESSRKSSDSDRTDSQGSNLSKESISKPMRAGVASCTGYFIRENKNTCKDSKLFEKVGEMKNGDKRATLKTTEPNMLLSSVAAASRSSIVTSPCLTTSKPPATPANMSSSRSTTVITNSVLSVSSSEKSQPAQWQSYRLEQVYVRTFGSEPECSHFAESDCLSLLKIAGQTPDLLEWVDQNAVKFSSVKPAY